MAGGIEAGTLYKVGGQVGPAPAGAKWVFVDSDGNVKTIDSTGTKSTISGGGGFGSVLARAQALLGPTIVKAFGTDFDSNWWHSNTLTGTGTANLSTTERGGVVNCSTGATAASTVIVRPTGQTGLVINPTTELWYMRSRARLTTTIDANSYLTMAVGGTGIGMFIGGTGNRSTTNFGYDFYNNAAGATVNGSLGVPLDTNYHVFELLGDTTNFYVYVDSVLKLTVAIPATTTNPCYPRIDAQNGATAANQQINVDDLVVCTAG